MKKLLITLSIIFLGIIGINRVYSAELNSTKASNTVSARGYGNNENFRLLIPNFNYTNKQEDIHLLQFRKGGSQDSHNVMIDVGYTDQAKEKLIPWLNSKGATQIDEIFITHPHVDHYGGLWILLKSNIRIKKIWMNIPNKEICDKEIPWGCDYKEIMALMTAIKKKNIPVEPLLLDSVNQPRLLLQNENNSLELLYTSSPINPVLGPMDINDLSMIMKLTTNGTSYLFTGDLNAPLSNYLAANELNLKSDILKAPHHGAEGVATNEFLDKVSPSTTFVPSPEWLWCSDRSKRYRDYFNSHNIKAYISGIHGDLEIKHFDNAPYSLSVQFPDAPVCKTP